MCRPITAGGFSSTIVKGGENCCVLRPGQAWHRARAASGGENARAKSPTRRGGCAAGRILERDRQRRSRRRSERARQRHPVAPRAGAWIETGAARPTSGSRELPHPWRGVCSGCGTAPSSTPRQSCTSITVVAGPATAVTIRSARRIGVAVSRVACPMVGESCRAECGQSASRRSVRGKSSPFDSSGSPVAFASA